MRPLIGVSIVVLLVMATLVATVYLLRRVRLTPMRLLVALFAGLLTDYLLRIGLFVGDLSAARWTALAEWAYRDLFGVRSAAVRIFYPDYYFPSADAVLPEHPTVELVADLLPIVLWTCLFGVIYFLPVHRVRQTI